MASKTRRTKVIRKRKKARAGAKAKAGRRTTGTTKSQKALFGD